MVSFNETSPTFSHYVTQLCAIIGGVFTVTGMIDRLGELEHRHGFPSTLCVVRFCCSLRRCSANWEEDRPGQVFVTLNQIQKHNDCTERGVSDLSAAFLPLMWPPTTLRFLQIPT